MEGAETVVVRQMQIGPMANFVYLIVSPAKGVAGVVDPAWEVPTILRTLEKDGLQLTHIFVTHGHMDHVNGVAALKEATGAAVYAHADELPSLGRVDPDAVGCSDGQEVLIGDAAVGVLHTPGHTPGSQCLLVNGRLLTGDTLFVSSIGRADLPGSSPARLFDSLQRLKSLDPATIVLPGHHYGDRRTSTIEHELRFNPYLRIESRDDFLRILGA